MFDKKAALSYVGGDSELLAEIIGIFREEIDEKLERMRTWIAQNNALEISRCAHSIKGELHTLGATLSRRIAAEIEIAGASGDLNDIPSLFNQFVEEINRFIREIGK
ncbi:Hpt domain-containing protein [bacterium]|nr:Hpt domain-containing protein [candidate division CSSED10-310 bacterium]